MASRKSVDKILLEVGAEKISQREWDFLKVFNSPDFSEKNIAQALLDHRASFGNVGDSIERLKHL
ncbi:hypothetical protein [Vibrio minamisatsumaniensis]|uniref:hypothetical protein n=1 Tax=Vibrio minamisatsumaniensis TaxID=2910243 RepID=UPI003D1B4733